MKSNLEKAYAEAKLYANKRSKIQQTRFAEFCESKRLKLINNKEQNISNWF